MFSLTGQRALPHTSLRRRYGDYLRDIADLAFLRQATLCSREGGRCTFSRKALEMSVGKCCCMRAESRQYQRVLMAQCSGT